MVNTGIRGQGWKVVLILAVAFLSYRFVFPVARPEGTLLTVGGHPLKVRVADTPEEREKGLSGFTRLGEEGMLFVLPEAEKTSFYMKQVRFPLSVAFIDRNGVILGIEEMDPREPDRSHTAPRKARYALEVRRGWFEKRGIKAKVLVRPESRTLSQPTKGIGKETEGT